jgi:DNA-binding MarR family transcriptional regulator
MHAITFQLKRGHLRSVAFGKEVLRKVHGMTPARFDFMFAVQVPKFVGIPLRDTSARQRDVQTQLGLHPMTISKMAERLEEMGWLERTRDPRDRRYVLLRMTWRGLKAIIKAVRIVVRGRAHANFFEGWFNGWWPQAKSKLESMWRYWDMTDSIAREFGDTSRLFYDFGFEPPNEDDEPMPPPGPRALAAIEEERQRLLEEAKGREPPPELDDGWGCT